MLHPQIVVHERDGRIAKQLRGLAESQRWALREQRQLEPLWRMLLGGGPTVLIVAFGESAERELSLIDRVNDQLPHIAIVAVGDLNSSASLASLSWDVGAAYVLFPPQSRDLLPDVVAGLMRRVIREALPIIVETPEPMT